jgi:Fic family protein
MPTYIHQLPDWPEFRWDSKVLAEPLAAVRHRQGRLIGRMEGLGFPLRSQAIVQTLTEDVLKSSEIEGEILDRDQVRSSIARRLGVDIGALTPADRNVEGVVEMMLDATQKYDQSLTGERLFGWHAALFPTGRSGMRRITVGAWRDDATGPMQVVSGPDGREFVHYEAPAASKLGAEMKAFLGWFNGQGDLDPMQLARSEKSPQRFYSMSAQIRQERKAYYEILEETQKGDLDITGWLQWFLACLNRAFDGAEGILATVLTKADFWKKHAGQAFNERQRDMLNRLLDGFEGKLTSSKWASIEKCSPDTALRDINELLEHRILQKDEAGGRSTSYSLAREGWP